MLSYYQFPQEGINHSLVSWLNGKVDYPAGKLHWINKESPQIVWFSVDSMSIQWSLPAGYMLNPCTRSCLFCTECGHCSAGLHCLLIADFVAPKATGEIIHHKPTVVYHIYQVMWSLREIYAVPSPGCDCAKLLLGLITLWDFMLSSMFYWYCILPKCFIDIVFYPKFTLLKSILYESR